MPKKAPIPVFFLVSLGLALCYWWITKPSSGVEHWQAWRPVLEKHAKGALTVTDLKEVTQHHEQTTDRYAGVWQKDWQVRAALSGDAVSELNLIPTLKVAEQTMAATVGKPRLRLELNQGIAWVYPQEGLTLYFQDGHLRLLEALPVKP